MSTGKIRILHFHSKLLNIGIIIFHVFFCVLITGVESILWNFSVLPHIQIVLFFAQIT